jgi:phosphoglycolate phosphatase-like HAD superfamily hydrolase
MNKKLKELHFSPKEVCMLGDSENDYLAALSIGIPFILRTHSSNRSFQANYKGPSVRNFDVFFESAVN